MHKKTNNRGRYPRSGDAGHSRLPGLGGEGPRATGTHSVPSGRRSSCLSRAGPLHAVPLPGSEGGRRGGLGRSRGLPWLGPPREPGRRRFAVGRRDVALLHARELPALLNQLQELRQAHRGGGCILRRRAGARAAPTARLLHARPLSPTRVRFRVGWVQPPSEEMEGVRRPYQVGPERGSA